MATTELEKLLKDVKDHSWTLEASQLTTQLNRASLDDATRLLLAQPEILARIINTGIEKGVKRKDVDGLRNWVLSQAVPERARFIETAAAVGLGDRDVDLDRKLLRKLAIDLADKQPPVSLKKLEQSIVDASKQISSTGYLDAWVDVYARKAEQRGIPRSRFTTTIKKHMVNYLRELRLPITQSNFDKYDEFFALAYENARKLSSSGNDPIRAVRGGETFEWDFSVDLFEQVEEQGVVKENILAAGALDYIFWLGDYLGLYKIVDAIVLRWSSGLVDVASPESANRLYAYLKLRDERFSEEERAMLYKRVLARGEAPMLAKMVVNESFPQLWHKLMSEVAEYIRKTEENGAGAIMVSVTPILQAARDLQYNLSEHATGLLHMQVGEMYGHLQQAIDILKDPEVLEHFAGGRRKNLWTVIEKVSKEEFGVATNVASLRTLAVEGNKIFRWLAEYNGAAAPRGLGTADLGGVDPNFIRPLLESGEAWIIAQSEVEGQQPLGSNGGEEEEPIDEESDGKGGHDEFADWND